MAAPARMVAFALVSAGLIALALALTPSGSTPAPAPAPRRTPTADAAPASQLIATGGRRKARLDRAARTFIAAFLRYEVGDLSSSVVRPLNRLTTSAFGRYLLEAPPRQLGKRELARIVEVEAAFLDPAADRALIRGVARRADGPEELSFVFILRGGRWLAVRAAE